MESLWSLEICTGCCSSSVLFKIFVYFLFLAMLGPIATCQLSLVVATLWLPCTDFSLWYFRRRARAPQQLWCMGLVALQRARGDSPRPGVDRCPLHWQVDNHWPPGKSYDFPFWNALLPLYQYEPELKREDGHVGGNILPASVCRETQDSRTLDLHAVFFSCLLHTLRRAFPVIFLTF